MRSTLESIYREHRQGLFTLALSITRSADRAEDAVHDAFARLCRGGTSPAGDPVAYVFAAVRNAAIDQLRRRREVPVDTSDGALASDSSGRCGGRSVGVSIYNGYDPRLAADSADAGAIQAETERLVRRAVDELPERQREALVMKMYAGLTFDQIARACDEPLSTVASRYRRALDRLRDKLEYLR